MAVLRPAKKNNFSSPEWRCLYCGNINRLVNQSCSGCGAQRNFILDEIPEEMDEQSFNNLRQRLLEDDIIFISGTYKAQNPFQVIMPSGTSQEYENIIPYWKQYDAIRNFDSKYNTIEKHKPSKRY